MANLNERELFVLADQSLKEVVDQIKDEQWSMTMPEEFATTTDKASITTLRDVINYHAYDDAWIPDMFDGRTTEEAGKDKFDGDLLGDNPKQNFATIVEKACAAVKNISDVTTTVHYSYGDYPANEALWHAIVFRGMRVHDLAKAIDINSDLPADLVKGLWAIVEPNAEEWRAIGIFSQAVTVPEDAPLQDRLLGLTGRQP